jgi:hypothetical protein
MIDEKYKKWLSSLPESKLQIEKSNLEDVLIFSQNEKSIQFAQEKLEILKFVENGNKR